MAYEHPLAYPHIDLEKEFAQMCTECGYKVIDLSYHHQYDSTTKRQLRGDFSPASLSIRLSPDILVSNKEKSVFYELKTGNSENSIKVEAYQLMLNQIRENCFCVDCIYVYKGAFTNGDIIGCHARDIVPSLLVIPNDEKNKQIEPILENYFQCEVSKKRIGSMYSGDAFIEVTDMKNWEPISTFIN